MQEFKKIDGSGTTTLIISNEEMNDIMKMIQALEDSNILLKGVTNWNTDLLSKWTKINFFQEIICLKK